MGVLVSNEEFDMGLTIIHDNLKSAVNAYKDYLYVFGTVPNMTLVEELEKTVEKILTHDGVDITPFRGTEDKEV